MVLRGVASALIVCACLYAMPSLSDGISRGDFQDWQLAASSALCGGSGHSVDLGGAPTLGRAFGNQSCPSACFGDSEYFVVWRDNRLGHPAIVGARLTSDGTVIDTTGILISEDCDCQAGPDVRYDGSQYLVVWAGQDDLHCARLSRSCTFLGKETVARSAGPAVADWQIAWNENSLLAVWAYYPGAWVCDEPDTENCYWTGGGVFGTTLSISGESLQSSCVTFRPSGYPTVGAQVIADGSGYLVMWSEQGVLLSCRVDSAGAVLDTTPREIATALRGQMTNPKPIRCGERNFLFWCRQSVNVWGTLNIAEISGDWATVGNTWPIANSMNMSHYAVATGGKSIAVFLRGDPSGNLCSHRAAVLDSLGNLVSPGLVTLMGPPALDPSISPGSGSYLACFREEGDAITLNDIYGVCIPDPIGSSSLSKVLISSTWNGQVRPCAAFGGGRYLAAWTDYRGNARSICAGLLDAACVGAGPGVFQISTGQGWQDNPGVTSDGHGFAIVWNDEMMGRAAVVNETGDLLAAEIDSLFLCIATHYPTISFNSSHYLVVWNGIGLKDEPPGYEWGPLAMRLRPDGSFPETTIVSGHIMPRWRRISEPITYSNPFKYPEATRIPVVCPFGTGWLVVWERCSSDTCDLAGAILDSLCCRTDSEDLAVSLSLGNQTHPAITTGSDTVLVVWEDDRNAHDSGDDWDIYGARIDACGALLDPDGIAIAVRHGNQVEPAVAFDGEKFIVTWSDQSEHHRGTGFAAVSQAGEVTALAYSGTANACDISRPVFCRGPAGQCLAVYAGQDPLLNTTRIYGEIYSGAWWESMYDYQIVRPQPNPFRETADVSFILGLTLPVSMKVYDVRGRLVRTLFDGPAKAGLNSVTWNGRSDLGDQVASGIYFLRFESPRLTSIAKVVYMK